MKSSLITSEEFMERAIPELLRRWDNHCYCRNKAFLKLISFDFRNYTTTPMALVDAELTVSHFIFKRFKPIRGWVDCCPQCGEQFQSRFDQYSINMDRITVRPGDELPMAAIGQFVVGFHYFANAEHELDRVTDFRLATSLDEFVDSITQ